MPRTAAADILMAGLDALQERNWLEARGLLETAVSHAEPGSRGEASARLALSDALWWTSDLDDALAERERAYGLWRQLGDDAEAAAAALWIGQERFEGKGDVDQARAWLVRAERLAGVDPPASVAGQCLLFHAALDGGGGVEVGQRTVALARSVHDGDLEALALSCLGMWFTMDGDVDAAAASFDDGMAIVAAGETAPRMLGLISTDLSYAIELWGDARPFVHWPETLRRLAAELGSPALLLSAQCCGDVYATAEDRDRAERELRAAIDALGRSGHPGRTAMPVARLAELLVLEGRFDEAAVLLEPGRADDATILVRARLALERGEPAVAVTLAQRALRHLGTDSLAGVAGLEVLVSAHLAGADARAADAAATRLEQLVGAVRPGPAAGRAALARARVLAAQGRAAAAITAAEQALDLLPSVAAGTTHLADAHLLLARLHAADAADVARDEARTAAVLYAGAGATHRTDEASALLRSLGERSTVASHRTATSAHRTGAPHELTEREREVLRLLATGLTNAEIARRLFISPKTAGNHVSSILTKLGLRSRVEATAYALAHPAR